MSRVSRVNRVSRLSRISRASVSGSDSLGAGNKGGNQNNPIEMSAGNDFISIDMLNDLKYVFHLCDKQRNGQIMIDDFVDKLNSVPNASKLP